MEIGLAILLFVCMTALLYVLLSLKITRQVDLQMKEFYKTRIHSDIQEFYREMEGYAALMENRIQRFKSLIERSEALPGRGVEVRPAEQPEIPQVHPSPVTERVRSRKTVQPKPITPEKKRAVERVEKKAGKVEPVKPAKGKEAKRQVAQPARPVVVATQRVRPVKQPLPVEPVIAPDYSQQFSAAAPEKGLDADTTIAEELMKDLFAQDEMQLSRRVNIPAGNEARMTSTSRAAQPKRQAQTETNSVTGIFARIGKALEPVVFGERPHTDTQTAKPAAPLVQQQPSTRAPDLNTKPTDFAEILRRAEQIKAEKKAERERAELEARAEFYTAGDEFVSTSRPGVAAARQATRNVPQSAQRNSLAVKSLDEHTISFLIDSLKHDAGYRKQALRALTENNIPLEEIARLSRIDIGELQLMSQLGKF
ncbi:MAG: hypothetical protein OHK0011_27250 [Turneriella sp.]